MSVDLRNFSNFNFFIFYREYSFKGKSISPFCSLRNRDQNVLFTFFPNPTIFFSMIFARSAPEMHVSNANLIFLGALGVSLNVGIRLPSYFGRMFGSKQILSPE